MRIDPKRKELYDYTEVYVRAELDGKFGSYDIIKLDRESLVSWLNGLNHDSIVKLVTDLFHGRILSED